MKYTSEEVIKLYYEYTDSRFEDIDKIFNTEGMYMSDVRTFEEWLRDKEQSEIPVKGQMIWVRDNGGQWFTRDYPMWTIYKTHKMISPIAITTSILGAIEVWDEYSLTNPNE